MKHYWNKALPIALWIFLGAIAASFLLNSYLPSATGTVAHISIHGPIFVDTAFGNGVSSTDIVALIEKAANDPGIRGILLDINSPGGSPVASAEIGNAIKQTNLPTVAWIRDIGASGGYWIASSTNHIIASPMSLTGSVGVIASYLEFSGLLDRYNVTYQRMVAGKYKDLATPLRELTPVEEALFQEKIDKLHTYFITEVKTNRNLSDNVITEISTGIFYLGSEAYELGLVDELGGRQEVLTYFTEQNITPELIPYEPERSFVDVLGGIVERAGVGIGTGIYPQFS